MAVLYTLGIVGASDSAFTEDVLTVSIPVLETRPRLIRLGANVSHFGRVQSNNGSWTWGFDVVTESWLVKGAATSDVHFADYVAWAMALVSPHVKLTATGTVLPRTGEFAGSVVNWWTGAGGFLTGDVEVVLDGDISKTNLPDSGEEQASFTLVPVWPTNP